MVWLETIDIESLQNRLLKVCYVPATSASLPRVSFFFSFLFVAAAIDSTNEANKVPLSSLYSQMSVLETHPRYHDTQHNDTRHIDIHHNDTQH
jgi:hypothetical protein